MTRTADREEAVVIHSVASKAHHSFSILEAFQAVAVAVADSRSNSGSMCRKIKRANGASSTITVSAQERGQAVGPEAAER